jgi:hypothetical protein
MKAESKLKELKKHRAKLWELHQHTLPLEKQKGEGMRHYCEEDATLETEKDGRDWFTNTLPAQFEVNKEKHQQRIAESIAEGLAQTPQPELPPWKPLTVQEQLDVHLQIYKALASNTNQEPLKHRSHQQIQSSQQSELPLLNSQQYIGRQVSNGILYDVVVDYQTGNSFWSQVSSEKS